MLKLKLHSYLLCRKLKRKNLTLALAESCTGGLLSSILTSYSGASIYFDSAFIVYSNQAKIEMLNIDKNMLEKHGAVSKVIALEMSKNLYQQKNIDIAIAITGIAGPKSDMSKKNVGLVYISLTSKDTTIVKKFNFTGSRGKIRKLSSLNAIKLIEENS